jgi:hypothetical protein
MCQPSYLAGKRRKLLEFDLGPDGPSVMAFYENGQKVLPRWSGPEDGGKVHRVCSCGHPAQLSRGAALTALDTGVKRLYR